MRNSQMDFSGAAAAIKAGGHFNFPPHRPMGTPPKAHWPAAMRPRIMRYRQLKRWSMQGTISRRLFK